MDIELKHADLALGVENLPTDEVHTITIDDRCFEIAAPKGKLDGRFDGVVRVEVDGQTFEQPLTEGHESEDMLSFRFFNLPWGCTATFMVVFEETEEGPAYTVTLLKDATITGEARESATPHGGTIEAPKTSPRPSASGNAAQDAPGVEDLDEYYSLIDEIEGGLKKVRGRQEQEGEISDLDPDVQQIFSALARLRRNKVVENSFAQAKAEATRRLNHEGVKQALRRAIDNFQSKQKLNPIDDEIFKKALDLAQQGIQSTQTYDVKFRVREGEHKEFYSLGAGGHAAGEVDVVTAKIFIGDPAWQHVDSQLAARFAQGKSGEVLAMETMADTTIHEAAGHILPAWCSHFAGGRLFDYHRFHEVLSATIGELTGTESQIRSDHYSHTITAEALEAWDSGH